MDLIWLIIRPLVFVGLSAIAFISFSAALWLLVRMYRTFKERRLRVATEAANIYRDEIGQVKALLSRLKQERPSTENQLKIEQAGVIIRLLETQNQEALLALEPAEVSVELRDLLHVIRAEEEAEYVRAWS